MKIKNKKNNKGFTLVEAMFAVFLLTFSITSLMSIVANSLFSARYARDEITANYLSQEVVDFVRNNRDTTVFLGTDPAKVGWATFKQKYIACETTENGCSIDVRDGTQSLTVCNESATSGELKCPYLYYNKNATGTTPFYTNDDKSGNIGKAKTNFKRKLLFKEIGEDEIEVTVTIEWKNGGVLKSRSLKTNLLNWQKNS